MSLCDKLEKDRKGQKIECSRCSFWNIVGRLKILYRESRKINEGACFILFKLPYEVFFKSILTAQNKRYLFKENEGWCWVERIYLVVITLNYISSPIRTFIFLKFKIDDYEKLYVYINLSKIVKQKVFPF